MLRALLKRRAAAAAVLAAAAVWTLAACGQGDPRVAASPPSAQPGALASAPAHRLSESFRDVAAGLSLRYPPEFAPRPARFELDSLRVDSLRALTGAMRPALETA